MVFLGILGIVLIILISFAFFIMLGKGAEAGKQIMFSLLLALCGVAAILPLAWILSVILVQGLESLPLVADSKIFTFLILILFGPIVIPFGVGLFLKAIRRIKTILEA